MSSRSAASPLPRGLIVVLAIGAALPVAFVLSGPWTILGRRAERLTLPMAVAALLVCLAAIPRSWRAALVQPLRRGIGRVSRSSVGVVAAAAFFLLARLLFLRFDALALSAWDTTLFYDRPLAETLVGRPFYSEFLGGSYFSNHLTALLFAFVPAYAVVASPSWLLGAEALALAAGAAAGFFVFRRILEDDLGAALLATAFVLHAHTARALQYGFHPEAFYPLAVFLLWLGVLSDRPALLVAGALLAVSVKEDAVLVLVGFAASVAIFQRRYRTAAAITAAGLAAFLVATRLVMPRFPSDRVSGVWYASFWASWGPTLPQAVVGMASHPLRLGGALLRSGIWSLLEPLAFLPLAGPEGLVAALPALVPYAASDHPALKAFGLYYGMPVLPFLFLGAAYGLRRLARSMPGRRILALFVLVLCAFDGGSYVVLRPDPARADVAPALASLGDHPVRIQGTLFPHAGYARQHRVLESADVIRPEESVLLAPATSPYPLTRAEFAALLARLSSDPNRVRRATPHGLVLFLPERAGRGDSP